VSTELPDLLRDAIAALDEAELDFAVMGGCARNAYAEPRATRDVDLVVAVDLDKHARLIEAMARRGFTAATTVASDEGVPDLTLFRDDAGRRLDLLFAHTDFERAALDRSRAAEPLAGVSAPVISVEDLIVYKLLADRPQDRVDVQDVVRAVEARGGAIDWDYVQGWCDAWEVRGRLERARSASADP
jgi:predicted nucleotidyltransferase